MWPQDGDRIKVLERFLAVPLGTVLTWNADLQAFKSKYTYGYTLLLTDVEAVDTRVIRKLPLTGLDCLLFKEDE